MKTHLPDMIVGDDGQPFVYVRTYCGRKLPEFRCINLRTTTVDEATCKECQRVDDARQARNYISDLKRRATAGDRDAQDELRSLT